MTPRRRRLLTAGMYAGIALVLVPFVVAAVSIAITSRVPEGLRGATHVPALKERVAFALGSASLSALLAPVGVLLAVSSGVSLAEERRRETRAASPRHNTD
ncbi:MAG TPA: hypothetical protein VH062_01660 [Polyangiaceae bacterium]|jgi:hypothetical protein|nr:hypothetical protein [Polyangiaceae bacterium]